MDHIRQASVEILGRSRTGGRLLRVNGNVYVVGTASGDGCNCLIDTLRQKLGNFPVNLSSVRAKLQQLFPHGQKQVTEGSYLELEFHWESVISFLGEAAGKRFNPHQFQVFCIDLDNYDGNGDVVGSGSRTLRIARENGNHFVPLLHYHGNSDAM